MSKIIQIIPAENWHAVFVDIETREYFKKPIVAFGLQDNGIVKSLVDDIGEIVSAKHYARDIEAFFFENWHGSLDNYEELRRNIYLGHLDVHIESLEHE